jgi:hypothetical protein
LEKDREKDRQKRTLAKAKSEEAEKSAEKITEKPCTCCCKVLPIELFVGVKNNITKHCKNCRDDNKKQDARRDKEHRNELARICEQKPERIAVKKEWKENNYDKIAKTWMNYRQRKIERIGIEEYNRLNAENSKKWRDKNPTKVENNKTNNKNSLTIQFSTYKSSALAKNLVINITQSEHDDIVKQKCYYCGDMHERGFNGIDRRDSTKGYLLDNCVSCCQMCNYMKGSLNFIVFIKRAEHIVSYNDLIKNKKYHDKAFNDYLVRVTYSAYKNTADKKNNVFEITKEQFNKITDNDCYICGKKNETYIHKNGIDRFNNLIGYILENCRSCCGNCNYMKCEYTHENVLQKFKQIYDKHLLTTLNEDNGVEDFGNIVHIVRNVNKFTKEQIAEKSRLKKQKQREEMRERYGDEEYKKRHAEQIAKSRANKKLLVAEAKTET